MSFFDFPNDDEPQPGPGSKLSREDRFAAGLESTPKEALFGRIGEITHRLLSIKTRYLAIAGLAVAGGTVAYVNHVIAENPAPTPIEHHFDRPDPCVANLPKDLAANNPALAMVRVQQCHDNNSLGGVLQTSETSRPQS